MDAGIINTHTSNIAGTELIGSINNYMTLTQLYPALNLLHILGPTGMLAVLGATMLLPAAISVARQVLNSHRKSRDLKQRGDNQVQDAIKNPVATSF